LVCLDVDGTLVDGFPEGAPYVWRVLHDAHGTPRDRLDRQRKRFFRGECTYDAWFEHDIACLRASGATRASLLGALRTLHPMDGVAELLAALRARGIRVGILSGSIQLVLEAFFPMERFDAVYLNRFAFDAGGALIGGTPTPYDMARKAEGLRVMAREFGCSPEETAFVGDAGNDVEAASAAGLAIAFNTRDPALMAVADHVLPAPARDLRAMAPWILGA
jgi:phosphoserine phosphatase